ncbi:MAG: hypothetical protein OEX22_03075 [Cyclobacteriaceae bacterium]|nr:hypothetical protein [Cyclobacteriaceae bacterium]
MERLFRAFWYLSVLIVFFSLMYSFAALPHLVEYLDGFENVTKDIYFYYALAIVAFSNFILYVLVRKFNSSSSLSKMLQSWLYALNSSLNLFFFVALMFVMMHNSNEHWNYGMLGYGIYITIGLIVLCAFSLPILIFVANKNINT